MVLSSDKNYENNYELNRPLNEINYESTYNTISLLQMTMGGLQTLFYNTIIF